MADWSPGDTGEPEPLDLWLESRVEQFVAEMTDAYERYWTPDLVASFERFVDDLSNWYIRRSRRRFWNSDPAALQTLWTALTRSVVVIAPSCPSSPSICGERCAQTMRPSPSSSFAGKDAGERDEQLLAEVAATRGVDLGRQARAASGLKLRQPLRRLVVEERRCERPRRRDPRRAPGEGGGARRGGGDRAARETEPAVLGEARQRAGCARAALEAGEFEELADGGFRVAGHELSADEVLVERTGKEGWAVAGADGVTVALDTALDAEPSSRGVSST